jgi:hypothetical protein
MFHYLRANPLAASALTVALIGTSIAIGGLPPNSVGTKHLKTGAVHNSDLLAHSVSKSKLAKSALPAKGATGAQGPAGAVGPVGPAGPTEGFAFSIFTDSFPSNTPDSTMQTKSFTTTTAGRIFGFGRGEYSITCSVGAARVGLYLDDTIPLAGSGTELASSATPVEINLFGMTPAAVAPGAHTIALRSDCTTGLHTGSGTQGDVALAAIVVGH